MWFWGEFQLCHGGRRWLLWCGCWYSEARIGHGWIGGLFSVLCLMLDVLFYSRLHLNVRLFKLLGKVFIFLFFITKHKQIKQLTILFWGPPFTASSTTAPQTDLGPSIVTFIKLILDSLSLFHQVVNTWFTKSCFIKLLILDSQVSSSVCITIHTLPKRQVIFPNVKWCDCC